MNKEQRKEILDLLKEQIKIVEVMEAQQRRIHTACFEAGIQDIPSKFFSLKRAIDRVRSKVKLPTKAQKEVLRDLSKKRKPATVQSLSEYRSAKIICGILHKLGQRGLVMCTGNRWNLYLGKWKLTKAGKAFVKDFC